MKKTENVNLKTTWVTKEGKHILIKDMSDSHISNTIAMLERLYAHSQHNIEEFLRFGCMLQGEQAQIDFENALWDDDFYDSVTVPIEERFPSYPHLKKEAKRRKLSLNS